MDDSSSEDRKYEDSVIYIILLLGWIENTIFISFICIDLLSMYILQSTHYRLWISIGSNKICGFGIFWRVVVQFW